MERSVEELKESLCCGYAFCDEDAQEIAEAVVKVKQLELQNSELRARLDILAKPSSTREDELRERLDSMNRLNQELQNIVRRLGIPGGFCADCGTLGHAAGCKIAAVLMPEEKRNDLLPIPPPLTVDTVVPDGKCWLCGRAATGKKGAEPRCEMHL